MKNDSSVMPPQVSNNNSSSTRRQATTAACNNSSMWSRRCCSLLAACSSAVRRYRRVPRLEDLPDAELLPLVALVGRPNVGKSALFNRLVRRRDALVADMPAGHVTRDYREGLGQIGDLLFRLADTSGLEPAAAPHTLQGRAALLTKGVLRSSSGVLMLLDARQGLVPGDEELLAWLRRHNTAPLMLLANKADTAAGQRNLEQLQVDLAGLGLGEATPLSATSGEGMADLYQLLQPLVDAGLQQQQQQQQQVQLHAPATGRAVADRFGLQPQGQPDHTAQLPAAAAVVTGDADGGWDHGPAAPAAAADDESEVDRLLEQHLAASGQQQQLLDGPSSDDSDGEESSYLSAAAAAAAEGELEADVAAAQQHGGSGSSSSGSSGVQGPVRLVILGLPNAGKSTLMNRLLGYERSLTGPEPGLTRDPTSGWLQHHGTHVQLIDTAGWKRPGAAQPTQSPTTAGAKQPAAAAAAAAAQQPPPQQQRKANTASSDPELLGKKLADASLAQAKRALSAVHVVVLLLDGPRLLTVNQAISKLELQMADLALSQGKALVIGINKADAVPGGAAAAEQLREAVAGVLERRFLPAGRLPVLGLSALDGCGADELLDEVVAAYGRWNTSVSSYRLRSSLAKHSLRFFGTGGTASLLQRIKWAVQLKPRPPTFVMLLRGSEPVDETGQRFLAGVLRQSLGLQGVPVRLYLRYNKRQHRQQESKWQQRRGYRRPAKSRQRR